MPCNLRVAQQRARSINEAVDGAVNMAMEEDTQWKEGMAMQFFKVGGSDN